MRVKEKHETSVILSPYWEWLYGEYVEFISEEEIFEPRNVIDLRYVFGLRRYKYRTCKTGKTFVITANIAENLIEAVPESASIDESAVISFL